MSETTYFSSPDSLGSVDNNNYNNSDLYLPPICSHDNLDNNDDDDDLETTISIQSCDECDDDVTFNLANQDDEPLLLFSPPPIKLEKSVYPIFQPSITNDPFLNDVIKDESYCDDYVAPHKRSGGGGGHSDVVPKVDGDQLCCNNNSNDSTNNSSSHFPDDSTTEYCSASSAAEFDFDSFQFDDATSPLSSALSFSSAKRPFSSLDSAAWDDSSPDFHSKLCKLDGQPIKIEKSSHVPPESPLLLIKSEQVVATRFPKTTNTNKIHIRYSSTPKKLVHHQQHTPVKTVVSCTRDQPDLAGSTVLNTNSQSMCCDRRKTKHHKVLSEVDWDIYDEERIMFSSESAHYFPRSQNGKLSSTNHPPYPYKASRLSPSTKLTSTTTTTKHSPPLFLSSPHITTTITTNTSTTTTTTSTNSSFRRKFPCKYTQPSHHHNHQHPSIIKPPFTSLTNTTTTNNNNNNVILNSSSGSSVASTNSDSSLDSSVSKIPPEPLRMGKKVNKRGQRFSLWQFLMFLLDSCEYNHHGYGSHHQGRTAASSPTTAMTGIKWVNRNNGIFHILDSKQVACLWGKYKERKDKMTYDSLARSLRHYYKKNLMAKINNRRLVYQIAQECLVWSTDTFIKSRLN